MQGQVAINETGSKFWKYYLVHSEAKIINAIINYAFKYDIFMAIHKARLQRDAFF